jgi:hypothetical protein
MNTTKLQNKLNQVLTITTEEAKKLTGKQRDRLDYIRNNTAQYLDIQSAGTDLARREYLAKVANSKLVRKVYNSSSPFSVAQYNANYDEWLSKGATEDSIALNCKSVMIWRTGELDNMLEATRGTTTQKSMVFAVIVTLAIFVGIPALQAVADASPSNSRQTLINN